jgi:hypothetical protein
MKVYLAQVDSIPGTQSSFRDGFFKIGLNGSFENNPSNSYTEKKKTHLLSGLYCSTELFIKIR